MHAPPRTLSLAVGCCLVVACGGRTTIPPPDPPVDAGPPPVSSCEVDLLFVVDNSSSMAEEQAALADALPGMLERFSELPSAPTSVRFGVVTSDLGTDPYELPTCAQPLGDDGLLQTLGADLEGCPPVLPPTLTYRPRATGSSARETGRELGCLTTRGNEGCGFEQPMEAALKALTPSTAGLVFSDGARGHGDGFNAGLVGAESILTVLFIGDEDDCSVSDTGIFDPADDRFDPSLNLRCPLNESALHPVDRYVDGFRALRADHPDRLLVAALGGVPIDLVADPDAYDHEAVLDDPRMQVRVADDSARFVPVCSVPELGEATPARRFVELTGELGEQGLMTSLCSANVDRALSVVVERIGRIAARGCR